MAAIMTEIEYGDWDRVDTGKNLDEVVLEATLRFCPWKLTHMVLEHDLILHKHKLMTNWKRLKGESREQCARNYISTAQGWNHYGNTSFQAEV